MTFMTPWERIAGCVSAGVSVVRDKGFIPAVGDMFSDAVSAVEIGVLLDKRNQILSGYMDFSSGSDSLDGGRNYVLLSPESQAFELEVIDRRLSGLGFDVGDLEVDLNRDGLKLD